MTAAPGAARIWTALVAVWVLWGSTYLGILYAVETIPIFMVGAVRFLLAGLVLYAWAIRRGDRRDRPTGRHWVAAAVIGAAMLAVGNPAIAWAEQRVTTGVSSLVIATVPLWMALLDRVACGRRLGSSAVAGLVVGFAGAAVLAAPGSARIDVAGLAVLLLASVSWAAASLYSRRAPLPRRPLVGASMEMIAAGLLLLVVSVALREPQRIDHVSGRSLVALGYLVVFGSLVGFTAYIWLLRVAPTSLVSTYAYANPVVAVALGWLLASEPIGLRTLLAGAMIVAAVALIVRSRPPEDAAPARVAAAAPARAR